MDPVINSQLQSPLARNLQHIASDITTFTYHVEQNAPPLSLHKTLVNPQSSRTGFDNTYNFRIPQYGQLAKMTLKLTYKIKPYQRTHVTPVLPLYHMIDRIDLMSHNNVIETHFGDTIMIKHAYYSSAETAATKIMGQLNVPIECDNYVDIAELFKSTKDSSPFNPFDPAQWNSEYNCRYVTLFCEVPLSFTDNPAMYLDTRFVEFLDVQVKLQSTKHGQPLFMAAACVELDMGDENIQLDPRRHSNTAAMGDGYMDKAKMTSEPLKVNYANTVGAGATNENCAWRWLEPGIGFAQGQVIDNRVSDLGGAREASWYPGGATWYTGLGVGGGLRNGPSLTASPVQVQADNHPTGYKGAFPYNVHSFAEEAKVSDVANGEALVSLTGTDSIDGVNRAGADGGSRQPNYTSIAKVIAPSGLGKVGGCKHFFYRPFYTRVAANDMSQPHTYIDQPGNMFIKSGPPVDIAISAAAPPTDFYAAHPDYNLDGEGGFNSATAWASSAGSLQSYTYLPGNVSKRTRPDDGLVNHGEVNELTGQAVQGERSQMSMTAKQGAAPGDPGIPASQIEVRLGSEIGGYGYVPSCLAGTFDSLGSYQPAREGPNYSGPHKSYSASLYYKDAMVADTLKKGPLAAGTGFTQNAHAPGANIYELQLGARPRSRVSNLGPKWMSGFYPTVDPDGYPAAAHAGEPRFIRVGAANFDKTHYTVGFWGLQTEDSTGTTLQFGRNPAGLSSSNIASAVNLSAQRNITNPGQTHGMLRNGGQNPAEIGHTNNDDGTVRAWALRRAEAMLGFDKVTCSSIAALWANYGGQYVYAQVDVHGTLPQFATSMSTNETGVIAAFVGPSSKSTPGGMHLTARGDSSLHHTNYMMNTESRFSLGASLGSGMLHDSTTKYNAATYRVEINTANCVVERFYAQYPYLNIAAVPGLNKDGIWPAGLDKSTSGGAGGHRALREIKVEGSANNSDVHGVPDAQDVNLGLLITYLHLHDKVREEVSMDNFKDNMPATILYHDTYAEYQGIDYGSSKSAYAQDTDTSMIIPLRSKHLAYAITIVAYRNKTDQQLVAGDLYNAVCDGSTPDKSLMDVSLDKKAQKQRAGAKSGGTIPAQQGSATENYAVPEIFGGAYSRPPGDGSMNVPLLDFVEGNKAENLVKMVNTGIHMQGRMTSSASFAGAAVHHGGANLGDSIMANATGVGAPRPVLEPFYQVHDLPGLAAANRTDLKKVGEVARAFTPAEGVMRIVGNNKVRQSRAEAGMQSVNNDGDLEFLSTAPARTVRADVEVGGSGKISLASAKKAGRGSSSTHYVTAGLRGTDQGAPIVPDESGDTAALSLYAGPQIPSNPNAIWPNYKVVENFKTVKPTYVKLGIAGRTIYETAQQTATASSYYSVAGGSYAGSKGSGQWHAEKDLDNLPFHYNEGNNRGEGGSTLRIPQLIQDSAFAGTLQDHMDATVLTFGLNKTDQLSNNGALGLSSATNAQLELKFAEPCRVSVYVHHHATLQIDSNTGVMSRSLDV